ncbi:MAG: bifunctional aspartate kinase/homoserine dehydrogenase I [Pyrinomonadaceae bacterium]
MRVLKFGGSSVANSENIEKVVKIVLKACESSKCIVVLSAMQGVTDLLISSGKLAESGDEDFRKNLNEIEEKHILAIRELIPLAEQSVALSFVKKRINELENICESVFLLKELSPRTLDLIVGIGEVLSTSIVSAKFDSLDVANKLIDSKKLIKTDSNHGSAAVNFQETNSNIFDYFKINEADLYLAPGFIASDENGRPTTLGRGGSDYTAAIFAAAVSAEALEIWTDVSGMMSANPRIVRKTRAISHITYREAMELSHFGAKIIYPPTIQPVMAKNIPVFVKNTFAPEDHGTIIETENRSADNIVRGITSIDNICILSLEGSGMVGIPGFSKRLFDVLSRAKINVILITQSSSEHSICVAVIEESGDIAKAVVDEEFRYEILNETIEPLKVETGYSCLALVGDNMKAHTGISGKMFAALGNNGINIKAIAQGSSERNISTIIASKDVHKAVNTLHEAFFSDGKKQINLYIVGVGTVGKKLLGQIRKQRDYLSDKMNLNVRVVGLADSKNVLFDRDGIDLDAWREQLSVSAKKSTDKSTSEEIVELIARENLRNSVFVDVTASEDVVKTYPFLLSESVSVVACNKVAASGEYKNYLRLKKLATEYNSNFLFETNVGAGLPIIGTLNGLMQSGDNIIRIEAVLSGTLNFVFNNYDATKSFASVVRMAQDEGYTEPDPRLDLSGADVARKIIILARESGFALEMWDVNNKGFLPESCLTGSVEDFYFELEKHEEYFKSLYNDAAAKGLKLKYLASFNSGNASVGLEQIGEDHNFANLSGKDNAVLFYTDRYSDFPLIVKGAGAGADVTAAGVFADIIRASRR